MAERPVFIPRFKGSRFIEEISVKFTWAAGQAAAQKKRNAMALHEAAKKRNINRILEVSSKSDEPLGKSLSAFNLPVEVPGVSPVPLECVYQGSKIFTKGGPFTDLYQASAKDAKRDTRLTNSGLLKAYQFDDLRWPAEPVTAFYDWLYLNALVRQDGALEQLLTYDGFTDIEYTPGKSVNCQARSCALAVSLAKRDMLFDALEGQESFLRILASGTNPQTQWQWAVG